MIGKNHIIHFFFFISFIISNQGIAQVNGEVNVLDRDIFYIQYIPKTEISNDVNYQKISSKLNFPLFKSERLSVFNTIGLDIHNFNFTNNTLVTNLAEMDWFYNSNISLFTNYTLSRTWSLNSLLSLFYISNFENQIALKDIKWNGNIFAEHTFYRKKEGYFQLGFGVGYMTLNGTTQINPIVQLKSRLNEQWSFVLGMPNTYLKWDFHQKHSLKILGDLNDFYANLNQPVLLSSKNIRQRVVFTTVSAGLDYNYWLKPSIGISMKAVYPIFGDYEIRDYNNNTLYDYDASFDKPFFSIGIKFNPIRNLQNDLKPL
ncbi:DUF6268 family outer membrane beta-barrel protein [Flavobacterium sp. J27]|uniref:DUF6268 family outer membrane beta-barrel protein n=1 Tax=Flavobacterium sp. J27 TaxID=2060419 RepID=UPI00102F46C4|nr:DUF6268 family outer membrane beta-barrel protein [Flavobacterium sp. J27]